MFITAFPDYDFQFKVDENTNRTKLRNWLEDNNIGFSLIVDNWLQSKNGYFTVRGGNLRWTGETYPINDLPVVDIIKRKTDNDLLVDILDSILKEVGYYRKGQNDPVIDHMKFKYKNAAINNRVPNSIIDTISFRAAIKQQIDGQAASYTSEDSKIEKMIFFYKTLHILVFKTYKDLKQLDVGISLDDAHVFHHHIIRCSPYHDTEEQRKFLIGLVVRDFTPKQNINNFKRILKPHHKENEHLIPEVLMLLTSE